MDTGDRSPMELRLQFGANLRALAEQAPSVAQLCRELEINRTQFNRYLKGASFPRPDILQRICSYFDVDARILLQPLETLHCAGSNSGAFQDLNTLLSDVDALQVPAELVPDGLYLYRAVSFFSRTTIYCAIVSFCRDAHGVLQIRGHTPVAASEQFGLGRKIENRRFRGMVFRQMLGFSFVVTMEKVPLMAVGGFEPNYLGNPRLFFGSSIVTQDVTAPAPMILERLDQSREAVMRARHLVGNKQRSDLSPVMQGFFDRYAPLT